MNNLFKTIALTIVLTGCNSSQNELSELQKTVKKDTAVTTPKVEEKFEYIAEQFADLRILRYQVKDFDQLPTQVKTLLYYLYEAALSGRDMIYDQNYKYNFYTLKYRHCY